MPRQLFRLTSGSKELKDQFDYYKEELKRPRCNPAGYYGKNTGLPHPLVIRTPNFCEHFHRYLKLTQATMHLTPSVQGIIFRLILPGKELHYVDIQTGQIIYCPVLVCTLPYSSYTYVEVLPTAGQTHMFSALNRCLEYLGGVPKNILSDNMKQYMNKNSRYEYRFQELADQWSVHYNTNLDATRPRKPKDKPSVENSVYQSYLRVYAKVRHEEFHSLYEVKCTHT